MTTRRKINCWNPGAGGHDQKVPLLESCGLTHTFTALIWNKLPGWNLVEVAVRTRGASLLTCLVNCSRQRAAVCFTGFSACVAPWDAPRRRTGPNAGNVSALAILFRMAQGMWSLGASTSVPDARHWQTHTSQVNQIGRTSQGSEGQKKNGLAVHLVLQQASSCRALDTCKPRDGAWSAIAPAPVCKVAECSSTFLWA